MTDEGPLADHGGRRSPGDAEGHDEHGGHGGGALSWLAVTVVLLGFTIGGVGLCTGPNWFLFCTGAVVCVMGGILLLVFRVFQDVVLDVPRTSRATGPAAASPDDSDLAKTPA